MEGSTPTWTEGTPSFTESSSSENEIGEFIIVEKLEIQTELNRSSETFWLFETVKWFLRILHDFLIFYEKFPGFSEDFLIFFQDFPRKTSQKS